MTYDSDNVEKLSIFVQELNRMKIKINPPCINFSFDKFTVEDQLIKKVYDIACLHSKMLEMKKQKK